MQLGELIEKRAMELGGDRGPLKLREVSQRARRAGYTLAEATISAFVNHPLPESPKKRTMRALAVALDVSYNTIVQAVAESMAEDDAELTLVAEEPHVRAFVTLTEGRTDAERDRMVDVIRSVAAALDASHTHASVETGERPLPEHAARQTRRSRNT